VVAQRGIDVAVALSTPDAKKIIEVNSNPSIEGSETISAVAGLARGFMYAGAPRIVASLWKVDDQATGELMKRFYQGMLGDERLSAAGALRQAQLSIWKQKQWREPYYWAAFVLQGEWK